MERPREIATSPSHSGARSWRAVSAPRTIVASAGLLRDRTNPVRRDVQEFRQRIDETVNQPRTRDAVDLRVSARDPLSRQSNIPACGKAPLMPCGKAAGQGAGINAMAGKLTNDTLARRATPAVVDDHGSRRQQLAPPPLNVFGRAMNGARDQPIDSRKVGIGTEIDDARRRCGAEHIAKVRRED